ncbi:MAG: hypothetical protein L6282_00825 [Candidatus Methanoperedenaceae archaeon]|nr:hypothetical protein [Candidatus Methanoperedenaceae archaeon]
MSHYLKTDLVGKVNNLKSFKSEALHPLFEAISNSVHAIEERGNLSEGEIIVRVKRQQPLPGMDIDEEHTKITEFEIEDNGVGFDEKNYDSFLTAETTYKLDKGGKGVGRFYWLKAFDKVKIESVYCDGNDKKFRKFEFNLKDGIQGKESASTQEEQITIVKLIGFKEKYRSKPTAYKTGGKIAQRILEHCMSYLIGKVAPNICLVDGENKYSINEMFKEIEKNIQTEKVEEKGISFDISHLKVYSTYAKMHKIVFCANNREVASDDIKKLLGTSTEFDEKGNKFFYCAYVSSEYLDCNVDTSRTGFEIPQTKGLFDTDYPFSIEDIKNIVTEKSKEYLDPYLTIIKQQKHDRIQKYVSEVNPALRAVPTYCPEIYDEIEPNTSNEKINEVLYKYKGKTEYQIKEDSEKLLRTQKESFIEIDETINKMMNKLEDFQKDNLAEYVLFRKMIIDLLDKKTEWSTEGKYSNEDIIHDIILPRKTTTDQIRFEDYNLWIIDERLTFHEFACSDKPLNEVTTSDTTERPDIVVFSEIDDDRIAKVVSIIEFKKPMRESFDNIPTEKVLGYVDKIREKKVKLPNGRPLEVNETTRFYCYIICDITEPIIKYARYQNFAKLKGERGYYQYNKEMNAHIEIIAFDKLLVDVKQRHKAFFDKMGVK